MSQAPDGGRSGGPHGTIARAGGKDGAQLIESRGHRWTDEAEAIFLDALAASANYRLSAKRCGFSPAAIYQRRRNDPAFAERCRAAVAEGVARIEALLVEGAENALSGRAPDPESPIPAMTVAEAIAVVKLHRETARGAGKSPGWRGRPRSLEEVSASILKKLDAFERARARR